MLASEPHLRSARRPSVGARDIRLDRNESPVEPYPEVRATIAARIAELAWRRYPAAPDAAELAARLAEEHGVPAAGVVVGSGSLSLLAASIAAFTAAGDRVAALRPSYHYYEALARHAGRGAVAFRLPDDFVLDLDALAHWVRMERPAIVMLPNPNNPTGRLVDVAHIAAFARAVEAVVVCDEAYAEFTGVTLVPLLGELPNLIVLRSLSKAYGLAAARVGYALTAAPLAARLRTSMPPYTISRMSEIAALVALDHRARFEADARRTAARTRALARTLARRYPFDVVPPSANFVCLRPKERDAQDLVRALAQLGVRVRALEVESGAPDWLRLSMGSTEEMELAFAALDQLFLR